MGYFDGLTDASFKKDASGKIIFYPWGVLGGGYVVESETQHAQIRGFIKKTYMVMIPAIILIQITLGYLVNVAILPLFLLWFIFMLNKRTKTMTRSSEKMKITEAYQISAKSHNLPTLIICEFMCFGFVSAGIWICIKRQQLLIGLGAVVFFGLCAWAIGYMIVSKITHKNPENGPMNKTKAS